MSERRWRRALWARLALAGLAAAGLLLLPAAGPADADLVGPAVVLVGYVLFVVGVEAVRRRGRRPARALVTPLVLVDGVVIAVVVQAAGGTTGPLEALVLLHVVAMAVIVSGRTGLEAATWHATLLLVPAFARPAAGITEHGAAYIGAGLVVAAFAAVDDRAHRRERIRLADQVRLLADLEPVTTAEEACAVLAGHVARSGFRRCAVLALSRRAVVGAIVAGPAPPVLIQAPAPRERGRLLGEAAGPEPVLTRFLDADADPLLDRLLPGAMNVVAVPITVDGTTLGLAVADWRPGRRVRIPEQVVQGLARDAAHCALALRGVLLLEQVEQRSRRDLLTGLENRRGFDEALDRELSRVERSGASLSLALIDLDHFKAVNDTQGHQAGDRVLATVGGLLADAARSHDTAARIGGDEFALLLPECGPDAARRVADRVLATVASSVGRHGVTASVGVATAPHHGRSRGPLVRAADEALYAAKAAGRNRSVVSDRGTASTEPVLVLDGADRRRPHRRADLRSRVLHPATRAR